MRYVPGFRRMQRSPMISYLPQSENLYESPWNSVASGVIAGGESTSISALSGVNAGGGRSSLGKVNYCLRTLRGIHSLVELSGWGVSATRQGIERDREGPRVDGSIELPGLAQESVPGWEDDVPLCQV